MKLAICSDLHLEFGDIDIANTDSADVLILSGDILVVDHLQDWDPGNSLNGRSRSQQYHEFFQRCASRFPHVIYILGNHEHYHGNFSSTVTKVRERFAYLSNVYILDRDTKIIDTVTFIGGTLWTDMNKSDALTLYHMRTMMSDFRIIWNQDKNQRFSPEDAFADHVAMKQYISKVVEGRPDQKFVVVGHHSPSRLSTSPKYANEHLMNGGFSSDMSEFILDRPQICLWTHGHMHDPFDYVIGSTRVVCNPRGYIGYEESAADFQLKFVTV